MNVLDILVGPVTTILNKIIPDPAQRAQAQLQMFQAQQSGEFKEMDDQLQRDLAQIAVNQIEAQSQDFFRSGWRPFVGWTCGAGLATQFLVAPVATWIAGLTGHPLTFPPLDMGTLLTLLAGLLGLGTLRTAEKVKGVG
jgi:Holin of 3TMs, for gene-transfer release